MRRADEKKPPRLSYRPTGRGYDENGAEWRDETRERHEQERDGRRDARTRRGARRLEESVVELVVIVDACRACRTPSVDGFFVVDACRDVVPVCFEPG